jgi:cell division protein FtsB
VHAAAQRGIEGAGGRLPFADVIQRAFGPHHDVAKIQAHADGASTGAAAEIGAQAFAVGHHVAFAGEPDLHTAAHEAAHVIQQAQGVKLYGGVGQAGDAYERHADAVADRVVAGESAADLLGAPSRLAGDGGASAGGVQLKETVAEQKKHTADDASTKLLDQDMTGIARDVNAGAGKLDKDADKVVDLREQISQEDDEIKQLTKKIEELRRTNEGGSHNDAINKNRDRLYSSKRDRDAMQTNLDILMASSRDKITPTLQAAKQRMQSIIDKVLTYGLHPQDVSTGLSYLRSAINRCRAMAGRMGLTGFGALDDLEQQLTKIFSTNGISGVSMGTYDLEHMGDDPSVAARSLELALDAVQAHVDYAKIAGNDLVHPVGLLMNHMEEAVKLMSQVDAAERKKLRARVNKLTTEVKSVHKLAVSHGINDKTLEPMADNLKAQSAK